MSEGSSTLAEGEVHDILRNDRRRAVIDFLSEGDGNATIRELSEHIAALESGEDPPPRNVRQSVYVSLHQTHLPKLEGLGVVDYDTDSKDVELQDQATCVEAYMGQTEDEAGSAWLVVVVGLVGVLFGIANTVGLLSGVDPAIWAVPLFAVVVALGGYQIWKRS